MKKFIILPAKGLVARASINPSVDLNVTNFLTTLSGHTKSIKPFAFATKRLIKPLAMKVLDSIHEDGAKLVEISPDAIADIHLAFPGVRIVPETFFKKAVIPRQTLTKGAKKLSTGKTIKISFTGSDGKNIVGATVVAFYDFENGLGGQGKTTRSGTVSFKFPASAKKIERIYVYPENTYWPLLKKNIKLTGTSLNIVLELINPDYEDSLRYFYKNGQLPAVNTKIKVAVIDTGVGKHSKINLAGGECTVEGEASSDFSDYDGHGTHVAGIISAFAKNSTTKPSIEIYSYRVFPKSRPSASNYSIVKAIDRAVANGCHIINMSLGGGDPDDATKDAITEAHSSGVICFVAAGNDDRSEVSFPASFSLSLAVSAMGRKDKFPKNSEPVDTIKSPFGKDKKNFVASFSNIGAEIDLIAPGVGIVSCAPDEQYAVMNGTSMACPAAAGIVARLLQEEGNIINQPANANRANSMIKFFMEKMKSLGFQPRFEGKGMVFR